MATTDQGLEPDKRKMRPIPERLTSEQQHQAMRMALYGATAREIAVALGVNMQIGSYYVAKYRAELQANNTSDRELSRAMTVEAFTEAKEWLLLAKTATRTVATDAGPVEVPDPNFDAAAKLLAQMNEMMDRIGEMGRAIGAPAAQQIAAESKRDEQSRQHEFAIAHPTLIPGLGYAMPQNLPGQVICMPKSPQLLEAQRLEDEEILDGDCDFPGDPVS